MSPACTLWVRGRLSAASSPSSSRETTTEGVSAGEGRPGLGAWVAERVGSVGEGGVSAGEVEATGGAAAISARAASRPDWRPAKNPTPAPTKRLVEAVAITRRDEVFMGIRANHFWRTAKHAKFLSRWQLTFRQKNFWCSREDSNLHRFPYMNLNHARLPIPPRERRVGKMGAADKRRNRKMRGNCHTPAARRNVEAMAEAMSALIALCTVPATCR